jgi:hypothetical protein
VQAECQSRYWDTYHYNRQIDHSTERYKKGYMALGLALMNPTVLELGSVSALEWG